MAPAKKGESSSSVSSSDLSSSSDDKKKKVKKAPAKKPPANNVEKKEVAKNDIAKKDIAKKDLAKKDVPPAKQEANKKPATSIFEDTVKKPSKPPPAGLKRRPTMQKSNPPAHLFSSPAEGTKGGEKKKEAEKTEDEGDKKDDDKGDKKNEKEDKKDIKGDKKDEKEDKKDIKGDKKDEKGDKKDEKGDKDGKGDTKKDKAENGRNAQWKKRLQEVCKKEKKKKEEEDDGKEDDKKDDEKEEKKEGKCKACCKCNCFGSKCGKKDKKDEKKDKDKEDKDEDEDGKDDDSKKKKDKDKSGEDSSGEDDDKKEKKKKGKDKSGEEDTDGSKDGEKKKKKKEGKSTDRTDSSETVECCLNNFTVSKLKERAKKCYEKKKPQETKQKDKEGEPKKKLCRFPKKEDKDKDGKKDDALESFECCCKAMTKDGENLPENFDCCCQRRKKLLEEKEKGIDKQKSVEQITCCCEQFMKMMEEQKKPRSPINCCTLLRNFKQKGLSIPQTTMPLIQFKCKREKSKNIQTEEIAELVTDSDSLDRESASDGDHQKYPPQPLENPSRAIREKTKDRADVPLAEIVQEREDDVETDLDLALMMTRLNNLESNNQAQSKEVVKVFQAVEEAQKRAQAKKDEVAEVEEVTEKPVVNEEYKTVSVPPTAPVAEHYLAMKLIRQLEMKLDAMQQAPPSQPSVQYIVLTNGFPGSNFNPYSQQQNLPEQELQAIRKFRENDETKGVSKMTSAYKLTGAMAQYLENRKLMSELTEVAENYFDLDNRKATLYEKTVEKQRYGIEMSAKYLPENGQYLEERVTGCREGSDVLDELLALERLHQISIMMRYLGDECRRLLKLAHREIPGCQAMFPEEDVETPLTFDLYYCRKSAHWAGFINYSTRLQTDIDKLMTSYLDLRAKAWIEPTWALADLAKPKKMNCCSGKPYQSNSQFMGNQEQVYPGQPYQASYYNANTNMPQDSNPHTRQPKSILKSSTCCGASGYEDALWQNPRNLQGQKEEELDPGLAELYQLDGNVKKCRCPKSLKKPQHGSYCYFYGMPMAESSEEEEEDGHDYQEQDEEEEQEEQPPIGCFPHKIPVDVTEYGSQNRRSNASAEDVTGSHVFPDYTVVRPQQGSVRFNDTHSRSPSSYSSNSRRQSEGRTKPRSRPKSSQVYIEEPRGTNNNAEVPRSTKSSNNIRDQMYNEFSCVPKQRTDNAEAWNHLNKPSRPMTCWTKNPEESTSTAFSKTQKNAFMKHLSESKTLIRNTLSNAPICKASKKPTEAQRVQNFPLRSGQSVFPEPIIHRRRTSIPQPAHQWQENEQPKNTNMCDDRQYCDDIRSLKKYSILPSQHGFDGHCETEPSSPSSKTVHKQRKLKRKKTLPQRDLGSTKAINNSATNPDANLGYHGDGCYDGCQGCHPDSTPGDQETIYNDAIPFAPYDDFDLGSNDPQFSTFQDRLYDSQCSTEYDQPCYEDENVSSDFEDHSAQITDVPRISYNTPACEGHLQSLVYGDPNSTAELYEEDVNNEDPYTTAAAYVNAQRKPHNDSEYDDSTGIRDSGGRCDSSNCYHGSNARNPNFSGYGRSPVKQFIFSRNNENDDFYDDRRCYTIADDFKHEVKEPEKKSLYHGIPFCRKEPQYIGF